MTVAAAARRISKDEQARLYRDSMGENAAERQKRAAATRCKSCFAPIIWAKSETTGRRMPIDYDPNDGGNVFYSAVTGLVTVGRQEQPTPQGTTRHFSHFATCPNADQHRRR